MDKNYDDRIQYRRKIIKDHHDDVVNINDEKAIAPAVREMYSFLFGTYLPSRYPSMFKLHETDYESGKTFMLENRTTGELYPASPLSANTKPMQLLEMCVLPRPPRNMLTIPASAAT